MTCTVHTHLCSEDQVRAHIAIKTQSTTIIATNAINTVTNTHFTRNKVLATLSAQLNLIVRQAYLRQLWIRRQNINVKSRLYRYRSLWTICGILACHLSISSLNASSASDIS